MKTNNIIKTTLKGYPSLKVLDAEGNPVPGKTIEPFSNVVTDFGRKELVFSGTGDSKMYGTLYVQAGTGATEITVSDADLGNPSGTREATTNPGRVASEVDNGDGTSTSTIVHTGAYGVGEVTGTLSEIGLFSHPTFSELVAGQLIKDGAGDPTTVTVLATEQLVIEYTIEFTYPNASVSAGTGSITDSFGTHNYTIYAEPYFFGTASALTKNYIEELASEPSCTAYDSAGARLHNTGKVTVTSDWVDNGDQTFTLATDTISFAPTDFSGEFRYLSIGANSSTFSSLFRTPATVEFDTYPNKQATESLTFSFSLTMSVS